MLEQNEIIEALEISRTAADLGDRATCIEGLERSAGVAAVLGRMQGQGADHCEDCGCEIPADRRAAAPWAVRCVHCQQIEDMKKGVRRG